MPPPPSRANVLSVEVARYWQLSKIAATESAAYPIGKQVIYRKQDVTQRSASGNNTWVAMGVFSIPGEEAVVGSVYRILAAGAGNAGATVIPLKWMINAFGFTTPTAVAQMSTSILTVSTTYDFVAEAWVSIRSSTTADFSIRGFAQKDLDTNSGSVASGFAASGTVNLATTANLTLFGMMAGSSSGGSMTSKFSILDRYR